MLLLLLLLISLPLVTPSYHIPKLQRYHTFLRIGKRVSPLSLIEQEGSPIDCTLVVNQRLCWRQRRQNFMNKQFESTSDDDHYQSDKIWR